MACIMKATLILCTRAYGDISNNQITVFPLISARALRKYFQKFHGRLLEGGGAY